MDILKDLIEDWKETKPIEKMNRKELIEVSTTRGEEVTKHLLEIIGKLEGQIITLEHKNMYIAKELAKEVANNNVEG